MNPHCRRAERRSGRLQLHADLEQIRQLDIDLYPPGAEPDSVGRVGGASE